MFMKQMLHFHFQISNGFSCLRDLLNKMNVGPSHQSNCQLKARMPLMLRLSTHLALWRPTNITLFSLLQVLTKNVVTIN